MGKKFQGYPEPGFSRHEKKSKGFDPMKTVHSVFVEDRKPARMIEADALMLGRLKIERKETERLFSALGKAAEREQERRVEEQKRFEAQKAKEQTERLAARIKRNRLEAERQERHIVRMEEDSTYASW